MGILLLLLSLACIRRKDVRIACDDGIHYLGLLENGKKKPTAELVMKVAQLFQVTTDQLLWDHLEVDATNSPGLNE